MELPFLPSLPFAEENKTARLRAEAETAEREASKSVFQRFLEELPKETKQTAVAIARDIPRSAASLTLAAVGGTEIIPETKAEKFLFGEERIQRPEEMGEKLLQLFGVKEEPAEQFGGMLGYPLTILGALPFGIGKKSVSKEIVEQLATKYGDDLAKQIIKSGGQELAQRALINGGEEIVSEALKVSRIQVTIGKLLDTMKKAKPIRAETERLFTQERAIRAAKGTEALEAVPGERGFFAALSRLKGELPKAQFEPIRGRLIQEEIDDLFDYIKNFQGLDFYDKISTMHGLQKVLGEAGGAIPQENELKLLRTVFGEDFVREILRKRPIGEKILQGIADTFNIPRALMSSVDMSAPLRQGLILSIHKPQKALSAFGQMFRYFFDERYFQAAMDDILKRPTAPLMKESKLYIADVTGQAITLAQKEERFLSNFAAKIPVIGKLVKASERAYAGFLNKLRADIFDDISKEYMRGGITPENNPEVFRRLAEFINVMSGRGDLKKLAPAGPIWNAVFFSPRFMWSRLQMMNPYWYFSQPPVVRKEAAKAMVKFIGTGLGILTLAKLGGAEVEDDPRSSDFGKIKLGNARWDIWAGFQQWVRFTAQMMTGEVKSITTGQIRPLTKKEFPFTTRLDHFFRFLRGKLAPVPSFITDLLQGETLIGKDVTLDQETYEKIVPIYIQDLADAVRELGVTGVFAVGVPGFFGIGTQVFQPFTGTGIGPSLPPLPELPPLPQLPSLP